MVVVCFGDVVGGLGDCMMYRVYSSWMLSLVNNVIMVMMTL